MRGDALINRQRLMAQAVYAIADHIDQASGYALSPVAFANLPAPITRGTIACISDSTANTWGSVIAGGGTHAVLAFYNGTNWTVVGA
jgi:hypothetical protein